MSFHQVIIKFDHHVWGGGEPFSLYETLEGLQKHNHCTVQGKYQWFIHQSTAAVNA